MFAITAIGVPVGVIVFFKGALTAIPSGWHLCDGTAGTDDLRDKMIICAGNTYAVDDSGGATTHSHADNLSVDDNSDEIRVAAGEETYVQEPSHGHDLSGGVTDGVNMPPYIAKGFIQKL